MAKAVSCRDVGADCDFEARADTEEELMRKLAQHAREGHNMHEIPQELRDKIKAHIREV